MNILNSFEIALVSFGKENNLDVVISRTAPTASTNGSRVTLPLLNDEGIEQTWGYIHHEAAHLRYTDFTLSMPSSIRYLWNVIEDIWIEYQTIRFIYPGGKSRLAKLNEILIAKKQWLPVEELTGLHAKVAAFCAYYGAVIITRYESCETIYRTSKTSLVEEIGQEKVTDIERQLNMITLSRSSQDNLDIALAIVALFNDDEEDQTNQSDEQGNPLSEALENGAMNEMETDKGQAIAPLITRPDETTKESGDLAALASKVADDEHDSELAPWKTQAYQQAINDNGGLVPIIMNLFEAQARARKSFKQSGKKVSAKRFAALSQNGNTHVFRNKVSTAIPNTAIALGIDLSYSMFVPEPKVMDTANEAALLMVAALEAVKGTEVAVYYFYHRVFLAKAFDETIQSFVNKLAKPNRRNGTYFSPFLLSAALNLLQRSEQRKCLLLLTDGATTQPNEAQVLIDELSDVGIEVYFIAIGPAAVYACKQFDVPTVNVNKVTELPQALMTLSQQLLL
ncbi:VWA domain-containing protein [Motilimonas pumila]|uniref:VWA domain-containing protein n=1 Tax=Motilimonas pumila TaxID=2303987 RepID=A0A418YA37_9GAMM|nr:VWA domain-containing protein [Motilimonas pumila]RJG38786.1 VWA domain-containing protein [Motilimonas pumila]